MTEPHAGGGQAAYRGIARQARRRATGSDDDDDDDDDDFDVEVEYVP